MPIDSDVYAVFYDGRKIHTGLSETQAYRHAEKEAKGLDGHVSGTKRRTPCIEVRVDQDLLKQQEALYKWAKHGG